MKFTHLRNRLGNPREWREADRVVLLTVCVVPLMVSYALIGEYAVGHPEVAPFMNLPFVRDVALRLQIGVFIPLWCVAFGAAIVLSRLRWSARPLVYLLFVIWFGWFGVCSYFFGTQTSLFSCFIVLGGAACGLTLFPRRPVMLGIVGFFMIVTGTTIAEQLGRIPYAPIYLEAPYKAHRLSSWYLVTVGTTDFFAVVTIVALIDYIVGRWKHDERALAKTSEQLARANEVISRYVASQLAQRIMAGDGSVEQHARRRLTLFFSDIKGFATIADRMEPEDLSEMLNEYLSEMCAIGERYGGTIDKFIGDAIMIFFGAPALLDDRQQARRAVDMAVAMQERLVELNAGWQRRGIEEPFQIRIGINTGQASIGTFGSKGRMDYTAIGRQVNLAARLQTACEPGKVLLSHSTWVLVQDEIACVPKGEIEVKGFHAPVRVYEVDGTALREPAGTPPSLV